MSTHTRVQHRSLDSAIAIQAQGLTVHCIQVHKKNMEGYAPAAELLERACCTVHGLYPAKTYAGSHLQSLEGSLWSTRSLACLGFQRAWNLVPTLGTQMTVSIVFSIPVMQLVPLTWQR